ncbi:MAG: transglutaminase domain-containing protein [Candidatus Diapherotrites archaeon]|nr:transglutaminase domain-containing protein [Candidatus Diapherotrites archaeon]
MPKTPEEKLGGINHHEFKHFADEIVRPKAPLEQKLLSLAMHVQKKMRYDNKSIEVPLISAYGHWGVGDCFQQAGALVGLLRSQGITAELTENPKSGHASVGVPHESGNVTINYYKDNEIGIRTPELSWRRTKHGNVTVRKRGETKEILSVESSHPLDQLLKKFFGAKQ